MELQDGHSHPSSARELFQRPGTPVMLGAHQELTELRADCSLSLSRAFILLPPLNHDFLLNENMFCQN